ncbi:hypothetical protein [Vagococcus zengguangii]|uniref:Uncharacterized protein n=1 Tax=Vagococcus zengguangii TaxID=2571750 RepID=A0A4D7CWI2_9ENTE|nr:hypothetical protein [Vagococcus zengguangii]QCI86500.1 hypothetical protein FA707_05735 [Vagococcus zengguangii]TLG81250.1 hypothetical protein FE258_01880 [Vagococcus zengguangii]
MNNYWLEASWWCGSWDCEITFTKNQDETWLLIINEITRANRLVLKKVIETDNQYVLIGEEADYFFTKICDEQLLFQQVAKPGRLGMTQQVILKRMP